MSSTLRMLLRYKQWADDITFRAVMALPEGEALKPRQTVFGNIVHTLNHVFVVDDIFRAHLESRPHSYTARNTQTPPPLEALWRDVQAMDAWLIAYADALTPAQATELVRFEFVGGGVGEMTREEILLHLVNHATYHRGFVADMMMQIPAKGPANDLTVFLRDVHRPPAAG